MKKTIAILSVFVFTAVMFVMSMPQKSEAMPFFARKIAKNCTYCHTAFPKLNETGRTFRSNGYRFPEDAGEGVWQDVKSNKIFPIAAEVEVEVEYTSKEDASGVRTKETELKIEEAEFMSAGTFGPNGEVTAVAVIAVEGDGNGDVEVGMGPAYVQVNDLFGATGEGRMNFRVGQWALALPFLGADQQIIHNGYLAEEIGVFTGEERAAELNGTGVAEEDSAMPTYRYAFGVTREDIVDVTAPDPAEVTADSDPTTETDPVKGVYGSFALTFQEKLNVGFILRKTKEAYYTGLGVETGLTNVTKTGIAAEYDFGKGTATVGLFKSEDHKVDPDLENTMVEVIVYPTKKIILGARYDVVSVDAPGPSLDDIEYATFTARYNIIPNVYAQLEWRDHSDGDELVDAESVEKGRFFLVALY